MRGGFGRWTTLALAAALSVGPPACSGAPVIADTPSISEADDQQATCKVAKDPLNPLIVEWPGTSKADLDSASQGGVVVVSYAGCVLKVLPSCDAGGAYEFRSVTPVLDKLRIDNENELYARLPLGVASLKAELASAQRLELEYVVVGQRLAPKPPGKLSGDCRGATHYVRTIMVGAYGLDAMGSASAGGAVGVGDIGAGGEHREQVRRLRGSGQIKDCASGATAGDAGKAACSAILQLGLAPLAESGASASARGGVTDVPDGMVRIPAGTFTMGSNSGDDNEKPEHPVTVAAFSLDVTEVTTLAYEACVSAGKCRPTVGTQENCTRGKPDKKNHPANCVDWARATAYCAAIGRRLPTEEEWEYAARGATGRTYPWGDAAPGAQICKNSDGPSKGTCEVGQYPGGASPFGALDMAGNVWEWTSSVYDDGDIAHQGRLRVLRGGSYIGINMRGIRSSSRSYDLVTNDDAAYGFRCAR